MENTSERALQVLLQQRTFQLLNRLVGLHTAPAGLVLKGRQHAKTANRGGPCAIDRRLDYSEPRIRSGKSRHRPTANGLYARRLAPLQRPDSKCGPNCRVPATEYTPALSGMSSRIRDWRGFAARRAKRSDRTVAAVRCAPATVCHASRRPATSILRGRR
jgi:hypothetical protein